MTGAPVAGDTRIRDLEAAVVRLSARVDALEQAQHVAPASQRLVATAPNPIPVEELHRAFDKPAATSSKSNAESAARRCNSACSLRL